MKLYTQIILSTYVFLPAICFLLSPTLIISLAKAQQQRTKLLANALTARAKTATALARSNARQLHKRLAPNAKYSPDLNIHENLFNLKRTRRQAVQMPMESPRLRSDLVKRKLNLNQEGEPMTTLQNIWNMNNFGTSSNTGNSMRHVQREESHNENIPTDGYPQLNHEKGSGSFFSGRNVYDTIVNQANPLNNNEEDDIETNETFDEHPNDFVDPLFNEDFSERTSKKSKKKKHRHRPHGSYGRSSNAPVMIMENPEETPVNPQLIQSMEARKSKKEHSRGHGSSNSYYGRESDLPEHITFGEPTLKNKFNAHAEERSPTKKSKKNKGHSWSSYYYRRSGEDLLKNLEQTFSNPEVTIPVEARKSKKQHSHGNFNSYYGRESDLPEEMIPSDPTLMAPLQVKFGDMEVRTHGKKSKKKHGSTQYYGRNGESLLELETPIDPQLMATTEERKSKNGHSCEYGNNNCYYSRQSDFPEKMIPNEQNLLIRVDSERDLKPELRSQYHSSEYYARNNGEVVGKVPPQIPVSQDPLVVVSENKAPIGTIPPPPQNSNMALVAIDPQTQMKMVQDPILASKADPRCKDEDGKEKFHEYHTPPLMPEIIDPNKYYQHTMEQVEEFNKKMAKATESLLYHPHEDTLHIPNGVSSYVRPPNPQYIDEIPQVTPYYEKSANPHHHHHDFSHAHTHTLTHSHGHIPNVNIGNNFAHSGVHANTFSHSKVNGFSPTRGLAEAQAATGNIFHGYGGGFSQAEAQANALANGGGGFNEYGGGFNHANAQAKALSGGGFNPVGPIGGGFSQADAQSKAQSGIGFGQYTDGFAQAGASSHDLGFGQSQANAQAISQSANNGFGQAASQALAQASSGTQAAPQFFQVLGPSSFVNAHARDATPLNDLSISDVTHEMETGKGRFSRAHGSGNDVFDDLNFSSDIVNSPIVLGLMSQPKQWNFIGEEIARNDDKTMRFIKNYVDSSIKAGESDGENKEVVGGNEESFDALKGSAMRIKRESGSKGERINKREQKGLNLASGIVNSVLDQSSRMQPNEEKARNENHAISLGQHADFPSGNLASSSVHSMINPTMSRLATNIEKLGIFDGFEKMKNPDVPATYSENTFHFDKDEVHSASYPKSLLSSDTFHSHSEPQLSDPQHISSIVKPEDSSLRVSTGNAMDQLNTKQKSLRARSEDAQFRKKNIDSREHDNLTLMINPDDISVEEEVRTEKSLTELSEGKKIENNSEKPMQEANNSSSVPHIHNTQLLSNIDQGIHKTQLADSIPGIEPNDNFGSFLGSPPIIASTADKLEEAVKQDHKNEIVGMLVPHFQETVTDISSIIKRKSPLKPNSSEESSEEKTKEYKQKQFSKPSAMSTSNNATQSALTSTMAPLEIENNQFTIPDEKEQFNKAEDITDFPIMNSTNAKAVTRKNTTGVLAENEEQSSDKDNSTNLLGNLEDVMKQLNEDEMKVFIKQEKDLIADILANNLHYNRTLKPEQVENPKESQSDQTVTSPHLFQAKRNGFQEEWERVHHEYARKRRSPVEKALDTILGAQREKVGQIQKDATGDRDLLMISFIGDGIINDLQNRKELAATDEEITSRRKRGIPDMIPVAQLLVDPNTRIDFPKTFDNMGAVLKHSFESPKAPLYHVRNMLGNTKNTVMSAAKIPPSNVVVPSFYEISKVPNQDPQLGAINEEMLRTRGVEALPVHSLNGDSLGVMDTFQKLGVIVKESVNNGKNVVLHASDAVHDARQALNTKPPILFGQKQILATKTSHPALSLKNKSVIFAPKLLDFQHDTVAAAQEPEKFVGMGQILDAIGASKPELSDPKLHKIVLEPTPSGLYRLMAMEPNQETEIGEVEETLESLNEVEQSVGATNLKDFFNKMHQEMKEILTSQQEERKRKRDEKLRSSKAKLAASNKDYLLGKKKLSAKSSEASPLQSTIPKMFEENRKTKLPLEVLKAFTDDTPKEVDDINFEQSSMSQLSSRINSENETVGLYLIPALMTPFMGETPNGVLDDFLRENGDDELLQRNSIDENKKAHVHAIIPLNLNVTIPNLRELKKYNFSDPLRKVSVLNALLGDVKKQYKNVDEFNKQFPHQEHQLSQTRGENEGRLLGAINPLMFKRHFNESLELTSANKTGKIFEELAEPLTTNKSVQTNQPSARPNLPLVTTEPAETLQINKEQTRTTTSEISDIKSAKSLTQNLSSIDRITNPTENEPEPTERTSMNVAEQYKKPFLGLSSQEKIQEFLDQFNKPYIGEDFLVDDPVKSTVYNSEDYNYL